MVNQQVWARIRVSISLEKCGCKCTWSDRWWLSAWWRRIWIHQYARFSLWRCYVEWLFSFIRDELGPRPEWSLRLQTWTWASYRVALLRYSIRKYSWRFEWLCFAWKLLRIRRSKHSFNSVYRACLTIWILWSHLRYWWNRRWLFSFFYNSWNSG